MWLTPQRSSVDKHLPRWPKIVQEQSQVAIWICVSKKKTTYTKKTHTHTKRNTFKKSYTVHTEAGLHGEKDMLTKC